MAKPEHCGSGEDLRRAKQRIDGGDCHVLIPPAMESVVGPGPACEDPGHAPSKPTTNKRNRSEDGEVVPDEEVVSAGDGGDTESGAKKARSDSGEENNGAHSDSDSYDDLEDDFETPDNMDDFLDEDDDDVMDEDDR